MTVFNSKNAMEYITSKGIPMSKSKLYKLTSKREIICHYAGNRLIFYKSELDTWCKNQIYTPNFNNESILNIIQSAQNK